MTARSITCMSVRIKSTQRSTDIDQRWLLPTSQNIGLSKQRVIISRAPASTSAFAASNHCQDGTLLVHSDLRIEWIWLSQTDRSRESCCMLPIAWNVHYRQHGATYQPHVHRKRQSGAERVVTKSQDRCLWVSLNQKLIN